MTHVLEAGFEVMEGDNPNGSPKVRGYNIVNGQLTEAKDGGTFESRNPAWLEDCLGEFPLSGKDDVHAALHAARRLHARQECQSQFEEGGSESELRQQDLERQPLRSLYDRYGTSGR